MASDVVSAWAGIRPLVASSDKSPDATSREHAIAWTVPGLLSVTGGKLTTYRAMAADVMDTIARRLRVGHGRAATHKESLPGGDIESLDDELALARATVGAPDIAEHLVHAYGTRWRAIWQMASVDRAQAERLVPELPYIAAELEWGSHARDGAHARRSAHPHGCTSPSRRAITRCRSPEIVARAARAEDGSGTWTTSCSRYRREIDDLFGIADASRAQDAGM